MSASPAWDRQPRPRLRVVTHPRPWGLVAEFPGEERLVQAAAGARAAGYRRVDAYSPFPVDGLDEALDLGRPIGVALITLVGGLLGAFGGYLLQDYTMAIDYPLNVGGRPLHSWPAFVPITFEVMVLIASLTVTTGLFMMLRLPQPHHPVFDAPAFARASQDRFFLSIEASDPRFDRDDTRTLLVRLGATTVSEVADA